MWLLSCGCLFRHLMLYFYSSMENISVISGTGTVSQWRFSLTAEDITSDSDSYQTVLEITVCVH